MVSGVRCPLGADHPITDDAGRIDSFSRFRLLLRACPRISEQRVLLSSQDGLKSPCIGVLYSTDSGEQVLLSRNKRAENGVFAG